jgi:hypothetical protein
MTADPMISKNPIANKTLVKRFELKLDQRVLDEMELFKNRIGAVSDAEAMRKAIFLASKLTEITENKSCRIFVEDTEKNIQRELVII